jgi:hypothetical protein
MSAGAYDVMFVSLAFVIVLSVWVVARHTTASRRDRAVLTSGEEYRGLAEEYRRLSDMAITSQEHTDLRLTEISVRIDALRNQLEQMQSILSEVE